MFRGFWERVLDYVAETWRICGIGATDNADELDEGI